MLPAEKRKHRMRLARIAMLNHQIADKLMGDFVRQEFNREPDDTDYEIFSKTVATLVMDAKQHGRLREAIALAAEHKQALSSMSTEDILEVIGDEAQGEVANAAAGMILQSESMPHNHN